MADDADLANELEEIERQRALDAMNLPSRRPDPQVHAASHVDCEKCGSLIGAERLSAVPDATLCIDCARLAERRERAFAPQL